MVVGTRIYYYELIEMCFSMKLCFYFHLSFSWVCSGLEPVQEFLAQEGLVDLLVRPQHPLADFADGFEADVAEPRAELMDEREGPLSKFFLRLAAELLFLLRHAQEQEVHAVLARLGLAEHIDGALLV